MDTPPFTELGLPEPLLDAIAELGFERPSPIQALTIPPALKGRDLIGLSQTGSGKTAAFALPTLARIESWRSQTQALVICPTRELALQVCEDIYQLGRLLEGLRVVPVYGGAPIERQVRALQRGAQVVVGTPGRLLDHLRRRTFDPGAVRTVILDEADRMLDMGFREEMEELLGQLPQQRQTLFFSATMNRGVESFIERYASNPQQVRIAGQARTVENIAQSWLEVRQRSKVEVMSRLLDLDSPRLCIAFANTKRAVDEVSEKLLSLGYAADRLHGDCSQSLRERTLDRFRRGEVQVLVATDVAARGLDVEEIDLVVNLELPQDPEDYVHRIGRTGRAGRKGRAVSLVFGRDLRRLSWIEKAIKQTIPREKVPSQEQVEGRRADQLFERVKERLESGEFEHYETQVDRLLEQGFTPSDLANALFSLLREEGARAAESIPEDRAGREVSGRDAPPRRAREERFEREDRPRFDNDRDNDHGPRPPRHEVQALEPGMARLFLTVGKEARIKPGDLVGMFYNEGGLVDGMLGKIVMFPRHSIVDLPADQAEEVMERLREASVRGKRFRIDYDRRA